jgi:hypothetical protein
MTRGIEGTEEMEAIRMGFTRGGIGRDRICGLEIGGMSLKVRKGESTRTRIGSAAGTVRERGEACAASILIYHKLRETRNKSR